MKKSNRVYGLVGISSVMANFNADFFGYPKTNSDEQVFGSDKALKFPIKKMWEEKGEKVLYIKSLDLKTDKKGTPILAPRTLAERYAVIFSEKVDESDSKKVIQNLFNAIDVKNFGATFAEAKNNISITGAVQIGQGFNLYEGHEAFSQSILSPFSDPKGKDGDIAKNSTLGNKILSNEAHYFFPFSINPKAYDQYVEIGATEGYIEEDYQKMKEAFLCGSTSFDTNSKAGCDNEFAVFIETEEDLYLPNLDGYIKFEKTEEKNRIELDFSDMINKLSGRIKSVEIYYNPYKTTVKHHIKEAKEYNIITREEV